MILINEIVLFILKIKLENKIIKDKKGKSKQEVIYIFSED